MHPFRSRPTPSSAAVRWPAKPTFTTKSLTETQRHLKAYSVSTELAVSQPAYFGGYCESFLRLRDLTLSLTRIDSPDGYDLGFSPRDEYCLNIPTKGHGWIVNGLQVLEIDDTKAMFVSPACTLTKHWLGPSDVITVHIPAHFLHNSFEFALPRQIAPVSVIDRARLGDFLSIIDLLRKAGDQTSPMASDVILRHLESAAIGTLLNSLSDKPNAPAVRAASLPYYVRRADHYMRANFRPGVTLKEIASAVGVSERSLQYGFKNSYGKTPLQFFKQLRLNAARAQIVSGLNGKTVSEIAWAAGYQKASQFTGDYRAMFGENPSRTARYARTASIVADATEPRMLSDR